MDYNRYKDHPDADVRAWAESNRRVDQQPRSTQQMTHRMAAPKRDFGIDAHFGQTIRGNADFRAAPGLETLGNAAYIGANIGAYANPLTALPMAAIDFSSGVTQGDGLEVAASAFGAPGKALQKGLAFGGGLLDMVSADEAEGAPSARVRQLLEYLSQKGVPPPDAVEGGTRGFHYSPHDFGKFEWGPNVRGKGVGAQAWGDGLYFTDRQKYAEELRADMSNPTIDGKPVWDNPGQYSMLDKGVVSALEDARYDPRIARMGIELEGDDELLAHFDKMMSEGRLGGYGRVYEVDIDASPEQMLTLTDSLQNQSDYVKSRLPELEKRIDPNGYRVKELRDGLNFGAPMMGDDLYFNFVGNRGGWANGDAKPEISHEVSRMFGEAGIPAFKYREALKTNNFVVPDADLVTILRKYGIAPGLLGGGAAASQADPDIEALKAYARQM
jgi:hypothetical protein